MQNPFAPSAGASTARGTLLILFSSVCFGSISVLTVFATREGMSILNLVFWRFLFAAVALLLIARGSVRAHLKAGAPLLVVGGLMQAVATYMSLSSLRFIPASVVAFLFFTYPAWLALTSAARGSDPLTLKRGGVLFLAMAGVALMIGIPGLGDNAHLSRLGIALALGSAILYSAYLPIVNHLQRAIPPVAASLYIIVGALISYFVAGVVLSRPWAVAGGGMSALSGPTTSLGWIYVLLLAIVSTVVPFLALMRGLKILGAPRTSIVATAEPFFTMLLVVVFLREQLRWTTLVGGALIAGAVIAIALEKERVTSH